MFFGGTILYIALQYQVQWMDAHCQPDDGRLVPKNRVEWAEVNRRYVPYETHELRIRGLYRCDDKTLRVENGDTLEEHNRKLGASYAPVAIVRDHDEMLEIAKSWRPHDQYGQASPTPMLEFKPAPQTDPGF